MNHGLRDLISLHEVIKTEVKVNHLAVFGVKGKGLVELWSRMRGPWAARTWNSAPRMLAGMCDLINLINLFRTIMLSTNTEIKA